MQRVLSVSLLLFLLIPELALPQVIKIGPLPDSSVVPIPVVVPGGTFFGAGIAGYFLGIHVTDATEVDILGVSGLLRPPLAATIGFPPPVMSPSPFGPQSFNATSVSLLWTTWFSAPIPANSGTNPPTLTPFFLSVHVKGTNQGTAANSDTDFSIFFGPIFHASGSFIVNPSWFVWDSVLAARRHINTAQFIPGSAFFAPFTTTLLYGIEHDAVPEPVSAAMMGGGLAALLIGLAIRRRRRG